MVAAIWLASLVKRLFMDGERFSLLKSSGFVAIASSIVMWASGYFMIGSNFNPEGWNYVFRWQPLSLIDSGTEGSTGWSNLLADRVQLEGESEAFSYLGIGVIFLMALSLAELSRRFRRIRVITATCALGALVLLVVSLTRSIPLSRMASIIAILVIVAFSGAVLLVLSHLSRSWRNFIPLIITVCMLAIYSMTNRVGIAQQTLFEYPLFSPLRQFTETFRTHGRSIWPLYYLLIFAAVIVFTRTFTSRWITVVLWSLLCLQIFDSSSAYISAQKRFKHAPQWISPMKDVRWNDFVAKYKNIVVVPPLNDDPSERWVAIDEFASRHQLNTNSGNFSRFDEDVYFLSSKKLLSSLKTNNLDKSSLYVIEDKDLWTTISVELKQTTLLEIDGFKLVLP
jgi:hypothetical protein